MRRILGTLVVVAMLLTTGGCSTGLGLSGGGMTITADLADASGLFVGNDVGILGVPVGKVIRITPHGRNVRVTMRIDADQPIPADAGAVVVARSVATDRYVELTPVYHSGPRMRDGAVIDERNTRTPVDFDQVLATLDDLSTGLAGSKDTAQAVSRFLASQSGVVGGKGKLIHQTIGELSQASTTLSGQRKNVTGTLTSLDRLTSQLAANRKTIDRFVTQVSSASQLLADERDDFETALRSVSTMITTVSRFAKENRQQIIATMKGSTKLSKDLYAKRKQLAELLEVMPLALQNLRMADKNHRLVVRIDPTILLPLSDQLAQICRRLPLQLCDEIGTDPLGISSLLNQLFGGTP